MRPPACDTPRGERAQTLRLRDGRRLAFDRLGDPRGWPVLYCHGFPSSRLEARLLDQAARAEGASIIAPDRPGYGHSDPLPGRTLAGWADDVAALADQLGLERFALVGVSGGGPYALACSARIAERIAACALVCPLGPLGRPELRAAMHPAIRAILALTAGAPTLTGLILGGATTALLARWPAAIEHLRSLRAPPADREVLARQEVARVLDASIREALRQGSSAALEDLQLYRSDWRIDPDCVRTSLDLWHGADDRAVPLAHGRWYAAGIRGVHSHFLPGEGHFSLPLNHAAPILRTLLASAGWLRAPG